MKPYYQDNAVIIYHGDCREILPQVEPVDLVLTDPPYNRGKDYGVYKDALPTSEYIDLLKWLIAESCRLAARSFFIVPRERLPVFLAVPDSRLIIVRRGAGGLSFGGWQDQYQPAVAIGRPLKRCPDLWEGIRLKGEGYFFREDDFDHPGYTPRPILDRAIDVMSTVGPILDPFMGSGTTLRAAKDLGRKAIGIEICEAYCETAAKRMAQEVLGL